MSRRSAVARAALLVSLCASLASAAEPQTAAPPPVAASAPVPAAPLAPPLQGAGSIELRIQTATNLAIGGQVAFVAAPGLAYSLEDKELLLNVVGGAGYFLTSFFALGLDASYTRFADAATIFTVAPFLKLVKNFERWKLGAFLELSPGFIAANVDGDRAKYVQLAAWGGIHVPVTDSAALVLGPTVTALLRTDKPGPNDVLLGDRVGLNVYLPANMPPAAERPVLGRRTFELRFQTGSHATPGGMQSPQSTQSLLYSTRSNVVLGSASGGGGIFLTDAFAFGGEISTLVGIDAGNGDMLQLVGLAAYLKLVSGMASWTPGVFVEASPAVFAVSLSGPPGRARATQAGAATQLNLWAGAHLPLGTSTAFVIGPSFTRFDDIRHFGTGSLDVIGARMGLSLYLPSKRKTP